MDMSDIKDRPREQQIDIIRRLRHGLRASRFAGIEQTDWKLDQILCPPNPENPTFAPDIVFVDFAFALQNWGEVMGCPLHREPGALASALRAWGVDREIMESCWFEATEEEY
ncbi:hypothetical protein GLOTRDRAFT_133965 [Gloeophyllum trabeum ATCC 11539]|uniref:Uncharacterized protein n=1 Tax=Gloeophyllum trabeum (strain ATCC 11539 / FP-39264 / Madison 617) TaxID=670483 RepID=S7PSQ4_GLOTA|nr:uncharacterized protein GLOTRDRAFT_133965 [Gloeophyllum trabeum ATCC 11539]EPQ50412.1 hypothetical protein GLOTRDRAFT_133965 [Gloeophyllum trabeum ATCC 11539]